MNATENGPEAASGTKAYHRKVSTAPALRAIGALTRGDRIRFDSLDAKPDLQESLLIQRWTITQDHRSLAAHNAERSMQAVRAMLEGSSTKKHVDRYYILPHQKDKTSERSWMQEGYVRKAVNGLLSEFFGEEDVLPMIQCGLDAQEYRDVEVKLSAPKIGSLLIKNIFDRYPEPKPDEDSIYYDLSHAGKPIGSRYYFDLV